MFLFTECFVLFTLDNELTGGVDLPTSHVLSHPDHRRYVNHSSSGSDLSLRSNILEQHPHDPLPPDQLEMNYHQNGRVRKQFVDTSSHAFTNPSDHSLGSNHNHFVANANSVISPSPNSPLSPTPPAPQTARFNPEFANGNPHPNSYPAMTPGKPEPNPSAGEKWEGRDLIKSSSANNDSGYVEHELSDSDEYFFKYKHEKLVNSSCCFQRNVAVVASCWQHFAGFDWPEI